jgi:DNA-binding transcriptional LysR family regulator
METNRLRQFRVIVETGNLRKAADILGISHSGLSKSMKALENEIGVTLFRAHGRGIVISDEGMRLYSRSLRFLDELEKLISRERDDHDETLRIGSFEVFTSYFVGPLMKTYLPGRKVEVHDLAPGRLEEALAFDRVDLGITYNPIPRKGIEFVRVTSVLMGAYARAGVFVHDEMNAIPFVVPVSPMEGAPSGVRGLDGWPDEKIERQIRFRVDLMTTGLELTRQGLCAIFIPRFVALLHNQSVVDGQRLVPLRAPRGLSQVKRDVFIVKRESTGETPALRQIAKALRDICRSDG